MKDYFLKKGFSLQKKKKKKKTGKKQTLCRKKPKSTNADFIDDNVWNTPFQIKDAGWRG